MITVYKNNNESTRANAVLRISFSEDLNNKICNWQLIQDKTVFDEQVRTGNFKGRFPIDEKRRVKMEKLKEEGIIKPYYGATSTNALTYSLQIIPPACIVSIEHELTEEIISFKDAVDILQHDKSITDAILNKEFVINDNECNVLQKWENWNAKDEFTSRYIYKFSQGSIGVAITVIDTYTKEQIDISDYINW